MIIMNFIVTKKIRDSRVRIIFTFNYISIGRNAGGFGQCNGASSHLHGGCQKWLKRSIDDRNHERPSPPNTSGVDTILCASSAKLSSATLMVCAMCTQTQTERKFSRNFWRQPISITLIYCCCLSHRMTLNRNIRWYECENRINSHQRTGMCDTHTHTHVSTPEVSPIGKQSNQVAFMAMATRKHCNLLFGFVIAAILHLVNFLNFPVFALRSNSMVSPMRHAASQSIRISSTLDWMALKRFEFFVRALCIR